MKLELADLTGQWILSGKPQSGSSTTAVLRLEPTQTFTASAMPCSMVPFGCPNDAGSGPPIDGSGTRHLQYGHPRSLQSESNPYTQVVLTFWQMRKGGQLVPKTHKPPSSSSTAKPTNSTTGSMAKSTRTANGPTSGKPPELSAQPPAPDATLVQSHA